MSNLDDLLVSEFQRAILPRTITPSEECFLIAFRLGNSASARMIAISVQNTHPDLAIKFFARSFLLMEAEAGNENSLTSQQIVLTCIIDCLERVDDDKKAEIQQFILESYQPLSLKTQLDINNALNEISPKLLQNAQKERSVRDGKRYVEMLDNLNKVITPNPQLITSPA